MNVSKKSDGRGRARGRLQRAFRQVVDHLVLERIRDSDQAPLAKDHARKRAHHRTDTLLALEIVNHRLRRDNNDDPAQPSKTG